MRFIHHLMRLLREIFGFAREYKAWWIIPAILILLLFALVIVTSQSAAPYIYTLF